MTDTIAPKVYTSNEGFHNTDIAMSQERLQRAQMYRDLSTVIVIPTRGMIPSRVVQSYMALIMPMNQKVTRFMVSGMEVGAAYSHVVASILAHEELSTWKYMLTMEEDNLPPPDGLLKLYEAIEDSPYCAVGGLYWTKGEQGQPMIYGKPEGMLNFIPQIPQADTLQECNGLGMGFTLWRIDTFKDERLPTPLFQTKQSYNPATGIHSYTQDLYACEQLRKLGYRVAVDTKVRVGHLDPTTDICW